MSDETQFPLGSKPRDWVLLWRIAVIAVTVVTGGGVGVLLYAGRSMVSEQVREEMKPVAHATAQEFARYLLKEQYQGERAHLADRVTTLEVTAKENRARIDANDQNTMRQIHRLELLMREGFARQGILLSDPPK